MRAEPAGTENVMKIAALHPDTGHEHEVRKDLSEGITPDHARS